MCIVNNAIASPAFAGLYFILIFFIELADNCKTGREGRKVLVVLR